MSFVLAVGIVLPAAAAARLYLHSATQRVSVAREAVNRETCRVVQQAAAAYREDLGTTPGSTDDLIAAGYLKALPRDFSSGGCKW